MKKFLIPVLILAACSNNASKKTEEAKDSSAHHNDHHQIVPRTDTAVIKTGQKVFFQNLMDGQEIKLPFIVQFGVEGMEVEPAVGVNENKGHHHLLVDKDYVNAGTMVPMAETSPGYYHFGKGQISDTLSLKKYPMLTPGKHTLRLQFANGLHISYGVMMSTQVSIMVK